MEDLRLKHRPSHWYLDMRQEGRTFESVASYPCDWLLLVLAMRAQGASSTKTNGKIDVSRKAFADGTKTIQHVIAW
jgi:hypothetical protein